MSSMLVTHEEACEEISIVGLPAQILQTLGLGHIAYALQAQSRVPCQVHYGKQCSQITLSLLLCSSDVPFSNSVTPPLYWPSGFDERQVDNFLTPVLPNLSQVLGAPIQSQITLSIFDSCAHPFHNSSLQRPGNWWRLENMNSCRESVTGRQERGQRQLDRR